MITSFNDLANTSSMESVELVRSLSDDEIRNLAPRCYCTEPTNPAVSKRYVLASTDTVIADMRKLGWEPVMASQPRKRRSTRGINSYHMVTFRNPNVVIYRTNEAGEKVVDCIPQIVLTNSHDGFNCFRFHVGLFRLVCSNGLIIKTAEMGSFGIRHINYSFSELQEMVNTVVTSVPSQVQIMNHMQGRELTQDEKRALALTAIRLRKKNDEFEVSEMLLDEMLEPIRTEDAGNNLWNVFNNIQEKIMNGNFFTEGKQGKRRKGRKITSISNSLFLNGELFKAATAFLAA